MTCRQYPGCETQRLSADLTLLKKMERESLLESLDRLVIHFRRKGLVLVVVGLNSPNCSRFNYTVKMSIPLGVSQVVSYYKEWRGGGGLIGYCHHTCSSWRAIYKPMSKGKSCSIM